MLIFSVSFQFYRMISEENPIQDIGYHNLQPHTLQPKADHQAGPAHSRGTGGLGNSAGRCFFKHLCFPPAPAAAVTSSPPPPPPRPPAMAAVFTPQLMLLVPWPQHLHWDRIGCRSGSIRRISASAVHLACGKKLGNSSRFVRVILAQGPC